MQGPGADDYHAAVEECVVPPESWLLEPRPLRDVLLEPEDPVRRGAGALGRSGDHGRKVQNLQVCRAIP